MILLSKLMYIINQTFAGLKFIKIKQIGIYNLSHLEICIYSLEIQINLQANLIVKIVVKMDNKSSQQTFSKIYNNLQDNPQKYSPVKARKILKTVVPIQIINQNLDQALIEVKTAVKNNSWKLNIQKVSSKQRGLFKNYNNKKQQPKVSPSVDKFQPILFTDSYNKKFEQRIKQIKERKIQLQVKSIEKQMKAKLYQKIKSNIKNKEKMQLLKDINEKKREIQISKAQRQLQKKSEHQFLHSCNQERFNMLRKNKQRLSMCQLKQSRILEQQSWKNMKFQTYLGNRENQERHKLMRIKQQFLIRTQSHGGFRKKNRSPNEFNMQSHREFTNAQNSRTKKSQDGNIYEKNIEIQSKELGDKKIIQEQVLMGIQKIQNANNLENMENQRKLSGQGYEKL